MCIKNDSKPQICLKFLKTSFFRGQKTLFFTSKLSEDWDRIYRIVTSIDLIAFPRTQCFCCKSPQNVDLFCSIGVLFETSKTCSEKAQVGEKIELF